MQIFFFKHSAFFSDLGFEQQKLNILNVIFFLIFNFFSDLGFEHHTGYQPGQTNCDVTIHQDSPAVTSSNLQNLFDLQQQWRHKEKFPWNEKKRKSGQISRRLWIFVQNVLRSNYFFFVIRPLFCFVFFFYLVKKHRSLIIFAVVYKLIVLL